MRIEDHTTGCVAHMAVLAGKLRFLGKSRSNPLCLGEWEGSGCCLVRLNVGFKELIEHLEVVRAGWPLPATWVRISGKLWFWSNGGTKTAKKWEFPAGTTNMRVPCSGWFSPSRVEFRELAA